MGWPTLAPDSKGSHVDALCGVKLKRTQLMGSELKGTVFSSRGPGLKSQNPLGNSKIRHSHKDLPTSKTPTHKKVNKHKQINKKGPQPRKWSYPALSLLTARPHECGCGFLDLFCLAHLNTQNPLHPQMSPTDLKVGGHELKCHKAFSEYFLLEALVSPPPNNFWPFLPNLEAHNAEILFQGRRIMSVIWRTEDPLPPTPQPTVKSRGLKKLHETVTCVSLQEQ